MIIVTRPDVTDAELDHIRERIETLGMRTHLSRGEQRTIIGCIGDESLLHEAALLSLPGVESVHPVLKPYKLASREFAARPHASSAWARRRGDRRARAGRHRRPVLRGGARHAAADGARRRGRGRGDAARRRLQAAQLAVRLPGAGRGGAAGCWPRCARRPGCPSSPR